MLGAVLGTVLILSPQRALAEEAGGEAEKGSFWEEILQDVNWEGIRDGVQEGMQTIGAEAAEKAERLSTQGQALAEEIKTQAKGYMEELAPYVEEAKTAAQQVIGEAGVKLEQAKSTAQQVVSEAGVKLEEAKTAAQQVVSEAGVKLEEMKEAVNGPLSIEQDGYIYMTDHSISLKQLKLQVIVDIPFPIVVLLKTIFIPTISKMVQILFHSQ